MRDRRQLTDRANIQPEDRETLKPCPACGMHGSRLIEYADGTFWSEKCRWCEGLGATDQRTFDMFFRWLKIKQHLASKGLLRKPSRIK